MAGRPSSQTLPLKWLVGVLAAIALLVAAERAIRALASTGFSELRGAQWIWAPDTSPDDGAVAFYLAREFELDFRPRSGRLWSLGDEEYVVSLNGRAVGSNRFAEGAPVDAYGVGAMLRPGRNRLLVEVRSSRGVGGLLLVLEARGPQGVVRIVSDGDWRALRRHRRRLGDLAIDLEPGQPVHVWGPPPTGRWGYLKVGENMPLLATLRGRRPPLPAARALLGREAEAWTVLEPLRRSSPSLGSSWVTFDWGREVTGYLGFRYRPGTRPVGLVFVGERPPYPEGQRADAYLIALPGRRSWTDSEPRVFRYATLIGAGAVIGAQVFPSDPATSVPLIPDRGSPRGVFGIETPPLRTPLEHKIWSELEGVAGVAVGEKG